jgi:hypothetical protein
VEAIQEVRQLEGPVASEALAAAQAVTRILAADITTIQEVLVTLAEITELEVIQIVEECLAVVVNSRKTDRVDTTVEAQIVADFSNLPRHIIPSRIPLTFIHLLLSLDSTKVLDLVPWFARAPSRTRLLALQLDT